MPTAARGDRIGGPEGDERAERLRFGDEGAGGASEETAGQQWTGRGVSLDERVRFTEGGTRGGKRERSAVSRQAREGRRCLHVGWLVVARVPMGAAVGSGTAECLVSGGLLSPWWPVPVGPEPRTVGCPLLVELHFGGVAYSDAAGLSPGSRVKGGEASAPRPPCWDRLVVWAGMSAVVGCGSDIGPLGEQFRSFDDTRQDSVQGASAK